MPSFSLQQLLQQFLYDPAHPLLFNDGFFVYFFTIFICLYYTLRNHMLGRSALVSLFSLYFFYKASGSFVLLVVLSAIIDYVLSNKIHITTNKLHRKLLLALSVTFNLGLLFWFKYTNFFIELSNQLFSTHISMLNLLLPIGISFYTFENLSYTIDVYEGKLEPEKRFVDYLLFLAFFPKLVMGPIVRASDFIPQLKKPFFVSTADFAKGFYLIFSGLFKKLIISDYLTLNIVNYIFENPAQYTGLECLVAVFAYAIVIYCDFSGYSDAAIGIAKWMGITIPSNFDSPYQSKSITEFWRRWHISLSNWLRDYLYIFWLGGNRKGKLRTYINLFITMLLGGFWHGAKWTFIVWGGLHGVALIVHKVWAARTSKPLADINNTGWYNALAAFVTFLFVCFCWIFFRADNFDIAMGMIRQIGTNLSFDSAIVSGFWGNYQPVVWMMLLGYALHLVPQRVPDYITVRFIERTPLFGYLIASLVFVYAYAQVKSAMPVMPIYLQF